MVSRTMVIRFRSITSTSRQAFRLLFSVHLIQALLATHPFELLCIDKTWLNIPTPHMPTPTPSLTCPPHPSHAHLHLWCPDPEEVRVLWQVRQDLQGGDQQQHCVQWCAGMCEGAEGMMQRVWLEVLVPSNLVVQRGQNLLVV